MLPGVRSTWLHDNGCRVLALMGGEPLLRPEFVHKVVYYAAKKGFWIYIATNGRCCAPTSRTVWAMLAHRYSTSRWTRGICNQACPKLSFPRRKIWNTSCANNTWTATSSSSTSTSAENNMEDVRKLTEYAHEHRIATDYHIK